MIVNERCCAAIYHATLQQHGVQQHSWDDLVRDYQAGLIFWLLMPVQDYADGASKDYQWSKMQCLVAAFREWNCAALLAGSSQSLL